MADTEQNNEELKSAQTTEPGVDQTRRRLTGAAVGSGVILTLKSHPVLAGGSYGGGTNECTKSALLSGNLSNHQNNVQCGCSPGYWGQHKDLWNKLTEGQCLPRDNFNNKFNCKVYSEDTTCGDVSERSTTCKSYSGSGSYSGGSSYSHGGSSSCNTTDKDSKIRTCAFHSVAALCNAYTFSWRFPLTPEQVKLKFKTAFESSKYDCGRACQNLTDELDKYNNQYCGYDAKGYYK